MFKNPKSPFQGVPLLNVEALDMMFVSILHIESKDKIGLTPVVEPLQFVGWH